MVTPCQLFISIARMHHIINPNKFRRLKRHAVNAQISGLVKIGRPGVLVFDGEKDSILAFLDAVRGLRYMDFCHIDTQPYPFSAPTRLAESKIGLHEVENMKVLIDRLDALSLKAWFRIQMGMEKGY
ncbi:hypothetical protein BDZ94DRAFT_1157838 [Collybia nuda]|uniref:Uncharacterized protein n=1 Tax=Collybia nuda TaxID=64659 RepID=A0A9P5YDA9_9AGAR|nr:hypothetical protein BDZ94DRAFT_1157838 [Collybia nuda]